MLIGGKIEGYNVLYKKMFVGVVNFKIFVFYLIKG